MRIPLTRKIVASLLVGMALAASVGTAHAANDNAPCIAQGIAATPPGNRDDFVHAAQQATDGPFGHVVGDLVSGESPLCAQFP